MDAKTACDKLNGFNFQNRYLVGKFPARPLDVIHDGEGVESMLCRNILEDSGESSGHVADMRQLVLYHQPEKMARQEQDLAARQENLEKLKKQHGID